MTRKRKNSKSLRQSPRRRWVERLEDRRLLAHLADMDHPEADDHDHDPMPHPIYAPGTPTEYIASYPDHFHPTSPVHRFQFNDTARWTNTATNGPGLGQGDATTITWGIVGDGTSIPGFSGEASSNSNLVTFLDNIYPGGTGPVDQRPWFPFFQQMFDDWADRSGITFVYEPNDDGVAFSSSATAAPGVLGVRADIRIGGHPVDGNSGILAYAFFPNNGEVVVDTNDNFYANNAGQLNERALRNVLGHEIGHALGLSHVCPTDETKLLEPFASTKFDGPQFDDLLAVNRGYGDSNEPNDGSTSATDLGALPNGTLTLGNLNGRSYLSIDDAADVDVFAFTVNGGDVTLTLTPAGGSYLDGPQNPNGSCSAGTQFNAGAVSDLSIDLLGVDGNTVLATANVNGVGQGEAITSFVLPAAGKYFARVRGAASNVQLYGLDVTIANQPTGGPPGGGGGPVISGVKFADLNGNGVFDTDEPGVNRVAIYVDLDQDGRLDLGEPAALTGKDGRYQIAFSTPGDYMIREVVPAGWVQTFPGGTGAHMITIGPGIDNSKVDFGNQANNDFGDAPDSYGVASAGIFSGVSLGLLIDGEGVNQPSLDGKGDDDNGLDDEDGVKFLSQIFAGQTGTIEVTVSTGGISAAAFQGWIDFNGDGDFTDAGEQIFKDRVLKEGKHVLTFQVPNATKVGNTFARFRYGYERGIGPVGHAKVGEVEDYQVLVLADVPVANDDRFIVQQNSINNVFNVLSNDFPSSAGPLTITNVGTTNRGGFVTIAPNGRSLFYTPARNFFSPPTETFTYTVGDGTGKSDTATVTVTVNPIFVNPIAVDDVARISAGSINNEINVLKNDVPGTDGPLTIVSVTQPSTGSVSIDTRNTPDPSDDVVLYTPNVNFADTDQFTYTVSNALGVLDTAEVTVFEQPTPLNNDVDIVLETTDLQGNVITSIATGQSFKLRVSVQDIRAFPIAPGVATAYLDVLYDRGLVSVAPDPSNPLNFNIKFADNYDQAISGNALVPGVIDEVGALQDGFAPLGTNLLELFSVTLTANGAGTANFIADPADVSPAHDVLLFDPPTPVPLNRIGYGFTSITITGGTSPLIVPGAGSNFDINRDGFLSPADALLIINELNTSGSQQVGGGGEGEAGSSNPMDVNGDGFISPLDALMVINALNAQAGGEGEASGRSSLAAPADLASATQLNRPATSLAAATSEAALPSADVDARSVDLLLVGFESTAADRQHDRSGTDRDDELDSLLDDLAAEVWDSWQ